MCARSIAAFVAKTPRSAAVRSANARRKSPIGVGTAATTATGSMRIPDEAPSAALEGGLPLLEKGLEALVHVVGRGEEAEVPRLALEPLGQIGFHPANGRVQRVADGERAAAQDLAGDLLARGEKLRWCENTVHETDAHRFLRFDDPRGADELQGMAQAHDPRQPLRAAVARDDAQPDLAEPQPPALGGEAHAAGGRQPASTPHPQAV